MSRRIPSTDSVNKATNETDRKETPHEKQARLLATQNGHFTMIRALHLADLITELNGFCGIMSIFSSLRYVQGPSTEYGYLWAALAFMPFGLFFDFMDGKVARWRGKSSMLGQELDSLADLISFGVAPAVCAFSMGLQTTVDTLLLTFFVLSGLTRLARFNVTVTHLPKDATGKSKYFEGTPIPTSLSIAGAMAFWVQRGWVHDALPFGVVNQGGLLAFHPIAGVFALWGCMMVSKSIKIPKL
ncbi:phosphatidylserine synthase [Microthyrium microscopicum]|uniref:CDP-diacylglycerol--serine O-phosphatidyltransferase n=1 Tax=Microthyrium microscopicum TaxID=703497 RepID=A0A6A6TZU6_9PEZI|nr:phosphatidylserine synthase [Microthyrium microscopicum]